MLRAAPRRWGHGLPLGLGLWVQGCKPKSIVQAGAEEVFPGGRAREQGTRCLPGLGQLADAELRSLCAGSRDDRVDGSVLQCKPRLAPISWLSLHLGTHSAVSRGWDVHMCLASRMILKGAKLCVGELLKTEHALSGTNMDSACRDDVFLLLTIYAHILKAVSAFI